MGSVVKQPIDLLFEVDALKRERDALVEDIKMLGRMGANVCPVCANYNHGDGCKKCIACALMGDKGMWHYRGNGGAANG